MANKKRDDFTTSIVRALRERVNNFCSNPNCKNLTVEPQKTDNKKINITGTAAHICAASVGGPRYNEKMSSEERKSIENGIWLCNHCARKIDTEPKAYSIELLKKWKQQAELRVLTNSNKVFHTETELTKTIASKVLESHLVGANFSSIVGGSLNEITKAVQEELKILDPRLNILCNYINNETHYEIHVVEDSNESVNVSFQPNNSLEFKEKYSRLLEHGESFEISINEIFSNSDALNYIFPSQIEDGIMRIRPTKNHVALIEIIDDQDNVILEIEDELIIGNKSFSVFGKKFANLLSISFKNINFGEEHVKKTNFDMSIHFTEWNQIDIRILPYFNKIKNIYEKIERAKTLNLKISVQGNEIYSASSSEMTKQVTPILNFLEYTDICRKISKELDIIVPFKTDISFSSAEHKKLFEISELLEEKIEQKKYNGSFTLDPTSPQETENLFKTSDCQLLLQQVLVVNDLKLFDKEFSFNIFVKHVMNNPFFSLVKKIKENGKTLYKYEIKEKDENSFYSREGTLVPFDNIKTNQIVVR